MDLARDIEVEENIPFHLLSQAKVLASFADKDCPRGHGPKRKTRRAARGRQQCLSTIQETSGKFP